MFSKKIHTVISFLDETTKCFTHHGLETPRLDAEVLLAHVLQTDRIGLYLSHDCLVKDREKERLKALVARRIQGAPVSYIIGRKEFWSLTFKVNPAVLVPRPQTETLIETALQIFHSDSTLSVLEIGTGSGAIAVALAKEFPLANIVATDISAQAINVAKQNAVANGVHSISFLEGDLYKPLEIEHNIFDMIISNPPYIPKQEIQFLPSGIRDYEPHKALDGGVDGLECYRKIILGALSHLKKGGWLLLEVGEGQSQDVCQMFIEAEGFSPPLTRRDLLSIERVVMSHRL